MFLFFCGYLLVKPEATSVLTKSTQFEGYIPRLEFITMNINM